MSHTIDLGDDIGFAEVSINGHTQRIDVWSVFDKLLTLIDQHREDHEGYHGAVCALLSDLGFGDVSCHVAERFGKAIMARVKELEKNELASGSPDSSASTGPESSTIVENQACS